MKKNKKNLIASLQSLDNTFTDLLQEFPADLIASAKEFEAFRRGRKIKNPEQLFQIVLLYCGLDYSLRDTAGTLTRLGTEISDQAVSDRLRGCVDWLSYLLREMLASLPESVINKIGGRWILVDGSTIQVPGAKGTSYRLHLGWDWLRQTIVEWRVTDVKTGESLKLYEFQAGDVVIADRGYARYNDLQYVVEKGGEVIIRCAPHILSLLDEAGQEFKLADQLWAAREHIVTKKVVMKRDKQKQILYLHCFRLSAEKAAQVRRKKIAKTRKDGRHLKKEILEYAEWVIILTSLEPAQVSAEEIGKIYRLRWQIEMVIKRLKSVLEIDKLRGKMGRRIIGSVFVRQESVCLDDCQAGGQVEGHKRDRVASVENDKRTNQTRHQSSKNVERRIYREGGQTNERKKEEKKKTSRDRQRIDNQTIINRLDAYLGAYGVQPYAILSVAVGDKNRVAKQLLKL